MKTLLNLQKLLSIAVLLVGISVGDCLAETQTPPPNRGPSTVLYPGRYYRCLDLLELERVEVNPQADTVYSTDPNFAIGYRAVAGWLRGFFTAINLDARSDGNVTKGATTYQMMDWIFSYCRAHPSVTLDLAAFEFMNALRRDSTIRK